MNAIEHAQIDFIKGEAVKNIIGKRWLRIFIRIVFIIGIVFGVSWFISVRHVVIFQHPSQHVYAKIPYLSGLSELVLCWHSKAVCQFSVDNFNVNRAVLSLSSNEITSHVALYTGNFDKPLWFWYSVEHSATFVIYSADLYTAFLSVSHAEPAMREEPSQYSKWWILSTDDTVEIHEMTEHELTTLVNTLENLPNKEFLHHAVPTLDIGFYKYYMSQRDIIDLVKTHINSVSAIAHEQQS